MKKIIVVVVLALAVPAWGEDVAFNLVVSPSGQGFYWLPQIAVFEPQGELGDVSLGPAVGNADWNLGRPIAPWNTVYATQYNADGHAGLTVGVPLSNGCVLRFQSGLLVAVSGGSYFQPCTQP